MTYDIISHGNKLINQGHEFITNDPVPTKWHVYRPVNTGTQEISNTTVKPVLSGHSKLDKIRILMTAGSLMKVESIAECSPWSILQYF